MKLPGIKPQSHLVKQLIPRETLECIDGSLEADRIKEFNHLSDDERRSDLNPILVQQFREVAGLLLPEMIEFDRPRTVKNYESRDQYWTARLMDPEAFEHVFRLKATRDLQAVVPINCNVLATTSRGIKIATPSDAILVRPHNEAVLETSTHTQSTRVVLLRTPKNY